MLPLILFFLGIIYYYYFYKRTKDLLNPIGLMLLIWCITASISSLYLAPLQQKWNFEMIFIVISSSIAVFFAGYLALPYNEKVCTIENFDITNAFIILTRVIFFISLACILIEWKNNEYILPGLNFGTESDLKLLIKSVPIIHYGSILMPFCGIYAFFEFEYTKKNKLFSIIVMVISLLFYAFMFSISRGTLLVTLLGMLLIQHKKKPVSMRQLIIFSIIMVSLFIGIAVIRIPHGSLVFTTLGSNKFFYQYISPIYTYVAYSFENLNKLVISNNSYTLFEYSLKPIWDLMGFDQYIDMTFHDTLFFNSRTYLYIFYHDLGFVGTLVFPFITGIILSIIYKKTYIKQEYILLLAALQKAIVSTFFGNYFFQDFITVWPYIVTGFVVLSLRYKFEF